MERNSNCSTQICLSDRNHLNLQGMPFELEAEEAALKQFNSQLTEVADEACGHASAFRIALLVLIFNERASIRLALLCS